MPSLALFGLSFGQATPYWVTDLVGSLLAGLNIGCGGALGGRVCVASVLFVRSIVNAFIGGREASCTADWGWGILLAWNLCNTSDHQYFCLSSSPWRHCLLTICTCDLLPKLKSEAHSWTVSSRDGGWPWSRNTKLKQINVLYPVSWKMRKSEFDRSAWNLSSITFICLFIFVRSMSRITERNYLIL